MAASPVSVHRVSSDRAFNAKYRRGRRLGGGLCSEVFECVQQATSKAVAVKVRRRPTPALGLCSDAVAADAARFACMCAPCSCWRRQRLLVAATWSRAAASCMSCVSVCHCPRRSGVAASLLRQCPVTATSQVSTVTGERGRHPAVPLLPPQITNAARASDDAVVGLLSRLDILRHPHIVEMYEVYHQRRARQVWLPASCARCVAAAS
jgi:hypothetical protein